MRIPVAVLLWLTAAGGSIALLSYGNTTGAIVVCVGCLLSWQIHVLEVKVNKLLDNQDIFVSDADLN